MSVPRVALLVGFLFLLGLAALALLLVLNTSPAGAQAADTQTGNAQSTDAQSGGASGSESAPADDTSAPAKPAQTDESTTTPSDETDQSNTASDSNQSPVIDWDINVVLPEPVNAIVEPLLPVLPLDAVQVDLPVARLNVSAPPVLAERAPSRAAPAPAAQQKSPPPGLPDLNSSATTNASASATRGWSKSQSRSTSELRAVYALPPEGDARAPLSGFPSAVAAFGNSVLSSSTARGDFGQSLLLFGVVAVGIMFGLGRGRRLLIEVTGWLRAPWCLLIERPG